MSNLVRRLFHAATPILAIGALLFAMGGTWSTTPDVLAAPNAPPPSPRARPPSPPPSSTPSSPASPPVRAATRGALVGKLNLNTATDSQLVLLPSVGPAKAERIITWRKRNGGFKRTADLRRVRGIGYRTFKKLAPYLDIAGDTTLARR